MHIKKKIVLALDGTWQDGTTVTRPDKATNISKLARAVNREDENGCPQLVYYESGVGSTEMTFGVAVSESVRSVIQGATGIGLAQKVKDAYLFVARNWIPGDEIYIFGFSRGAYTARTTAALIGDIGIIGKEDQESFWEIYENYQLLGSMDQSERSKADKFLVPWRQKKAEWEAKNLTDSFTVKVLGVFDTVGALGIPGFVPKEINYFGFNDLRLGRHIQHAFHAMSLNENRKPFPVTKWAFDDSYQPIHGQTATQVWFAGAHSDVGGGGWPDGDLAAISLIWMASKVKDMLSLDASFLVNDRHFQAYRPWGKLPPHDSIKESIIPHVDAYTSYRTGNIELKLPNSSGTAAELLHSSVLEQEFSQVPIVWPEEMRKIIRGAKAAGFVEELDPLEQALKNTKFQQAQLKAGGVGPLPDYGPMVNAQSGFTRVLARLGFK